MTNQVTGDGLAEAERLIAAGQAVDIIEIERRLREAFDVLRRLHVRNLFPAGFRCSLPSEMVRDEFIEIASEEPSRGGAPSPDEIRRMSEVVEVWLAQLDRDTRLIVWMRAGRYKWKHITRACNRSERHCRGRWTDALNRFVALAQKKKQDSKKTLPGLPAI